MSTKILNLTQHRATPEQVAAGVIDLPENLRAEISRLLTFDDLPTTDMLKSRAQAIALLVEDFGADAAMIGGAPFFMSELEYALDHFGLEPLYAFSKRESVETKQADGSTKKESIFRHLGFVKVTIPV